MVSGAGLAQVGLMEMIRPSLITQGIRHGFMDRNAVRSRGRDAGCFVPEVAAAVRYMPRSEEFYRAIPVHIPRDYELDKIVSVMRRR